MNNTNIHFIDKTILTTPKPCASSTESRREFLQAIDKKYGKRITNHESLTEENESDSSLGIIYDINNRDDLVSRIDGNNINSYLQKQRQLAEHTLEKSRVGLPAKFLVPSDTPRYISKKSYNDLSTVNESDLLRSQDSKLRSSIGMGIFNPNDMSTPKSSSATNSDLKQCRQTSFPDINVFAQKLRNSDLSIKDVSSELNRFSIGNLSRQSVGLNIDSGMFIPAELMEDQLLRDEMSWRNEKGLPKYTRNNSSVSSLDPSEDYSEKCSVGGFFQCKSDNINDKFFKTSPEKNDPIPLVDLTNSSNFEASQTRVKEDSVINISEIAHILSKHESEDTQKILNCLINKKHSSKDDTNSTVTSERDVDDYISAKKMQNKYAEASCSLPNFHQPSELIDNNLQGVEISSTLRENNNRISITGNFDRFRGSAENLQTATSTTKTPLSSNFLNLSGKKFNKSSSIIKSPICLDVPSTIVNSPTENKENLSDGDRSLTSIRSVSSLDTLPDGKSPIKSNRLELIWGCLKVGRSSIQDFLIKSQLNQKIRMQVSITGSSFRIVKDSHDSEMLTTTSFVLRPSETKSFSIMFCPTTRGAASEKINFYPVFGGEVCHSKRQMLTLFGYGGHVNCDIVNVAKESTGKLWLSLGRIEHQTYIEEKFNIKNNGTLFAFACLDVSSKGPFTFANLTIQPNEFIIKPQEEVSVTVRYSPSKRDAQFFLRKDILEIGYIKVTTGAEVTRGRLRRLYTKLKYQNTPTDPLIERLSKIFPGERMPSDLKYLKESVSAVKDLLQQLSFKEITITLEQDLESTLVNPIADIEETTMYQTLYQDLSSTHFLDGTTIRKDKPVQFSVEPIAIMLTLPMKREDTFLIHSQSSQRLPFEIKTEPDNVLSVCPNKGHISSYETMVVKITCHDLSLKSFKDMGRVSVHVGDDVVEITVKIVLIKSE